MELDKKALFANFESKDEVRQIATLWAIEQIKNISDPIEATKKYKELQQAFIANY